MSPPHEPFAILVGTGNAALGDAVARQLGVARARCEHLVSVAPLLAEAIRRSAPP